jgi:hypothetical protein
MRHRSHDRWVAAAVLAAAGACATEAPAPGSAVTQPIITPPSGGPCASFQCGSNSPVIDTFELHELSLRPGERNAQDFEIEAGRAPMLVQRGVTYELRVVDGRIGGVLRGERPLEGQALVDATIPVRRGAAHYELVIRSVRELTYAVAPFDPVEAYTLEWRDRNGDHPTTNLCSNRAELERQLATDPEGAQQELLGLTTAEAVVYEGDRVDADKLTMAPAADDHWFNFGCAGHTLAKLRFTHNTVHSQAPKLPDAWQQRQATLKLLTADYCDAGVPFTVAGQPLSWQGDAVTYWGQPRSLEARWNERGATCVNEPRMMFPTELGKETFPDIWLAIGDVCKVPLCSNLRLDDYDGALRMSANR